MSGTKNEEDQLVLVHLDWRKAAAAGNLAWMTRANQVVYEAEQQKRSALRARQHRNFQVVVHQDVEASSCSEGDFDEGPIDGGLSSVVGVHGVRRAHRVNFRLRRSSARPLLAKRNPRRRKRVGFAVDPGRFDEADGHESLLDMFLDLVPVAKVRRYFESLALVEHGNGHDASPLVGAPDGAGVGTPTVGAEEGGASDSPTDAPPTPSTSDPAAPEGEAHA